MEVAAFVCVKARRLVPFQSAASSEYIYNQIISVSRLPVVIDMQADVTSALRMQSDSLIRGDKVTTRARARDRLLEKTNGKPNIVTRRVTGQLLLA